METEKILAELPKFLEQIDLANLHDGRNIFRNEYFSIVILIKKGEKTRYYAMFNTMLFGHIYDISLQHDGPRNKHNKDGIEILEDHYYYSFMPIKLTGNMKTISHYAFKPELYHALK